MAFTGGKAHSALFWPAWLLAVIAWVPPASEAATTRPCCERNTLPADCQDFPALTPSTCHTAFRWILLLAGASALQQV